MTMGVKPAVQSREQQCKDCLLWCHCWRSAWSGGRPTSVYVLMLASEEDVNTVVEEDAADARVLS